MDKNKLYLYDEIGGQGINALDVIKSLSETSGDLDVHINSGGGSVSQGVSIYNTIKQYDRGSVTVYVDALAASIASIIALSGDKLIMAEGSLLMWHYAHTIMAGNTNDFRKEAEVLEQHNNTLIDIYESNTPLSREEIDAMMAEETWLTADEAYELGIATDIAGELKQAASIDLDRFNNYPNELLDIIDLGENDDTAEQNRVENNAEEVYINTDDNSEVNDNFARLEAARQRLATLEKLAAL